MAGTYDMSWLVEAESTVAQMKADQRSNPTQFTATTFTPTFNSSLISTGTAALQGATMNLADVIRRLQAVEADLGYLHRG